MSSLYPSIKIKSYYLPWFRFNVPWPWSFPMSYPPVRSDPPEGFLHYRFTMDFFHSQKVLFLHTLSPPTPHPLLQPFFHKVRLPFFCVSYTFSILTSPTKVNEDSCYPMRWGPMSPTMSRPLPSVLSILSKLSPDHSTRTFLWHPVVVYRKVVHSTPETGVRF